MTPLDSSEVPPPTAPLVNPAELAAWVRHEDDRLLVLDKPGWLVLHPSKQGPWSSLAGALREGRGIDPVRFVYRLDRETSGVVIVAKDESTGSRLQKALGARLLGKVYVALLEGTLDGVVEVEQAVGPDPTADVTVRQRVVAADHPQAQAARTVFHPLAAAGGFTLAGIELHTGRKHQIRTHAEWLGRRVVGDKLYGPDPTLYREFAVRGWTERHASLLPLARQGLHCAAIDLRPARFDHRFTAPWPADLARFAVRAMGLGPDEAQARIDAFVARLYPDSASTS